MFHNAKNVKIRMYAKLKKIFMGLNNYKSAHKSFKSKKRETQKLFHEHYIQDDHEGKDNWQFRLIDQCTTNAKLRKREL